MLKAWNGRTWAKTSLAAGSSSGVSMAAIAAELESPTSTVSSAAFVELVGNSSGLCDSGITRDEISEEFLKQLPVQRDGIRNSTPFPSALASESGRGNTSDHVPCGNFVEKFTDLLQSTSSADQRYSEAGGESDNSSGSGGDGRGGGGGGGGDGGCDYYEDENNYWDTILNLVNSSPSDSPIF